MLVLTAFTRKNMKKGMELKLWSCYFYKKMSTRWYFNFILHS